MSENCKENIKEFVVTVRTLENGEKEYNLHKMNECSVTKDLLKYQREYYSYDTYEEAKNAHSNLRYCKYCKSIEEKRKAIRKENRKSDIFCFIIAIICFIIGIFISTDTTFGRIMVGIIFAVVGAVFTVIYSYLCEKLASKILKSPASKKTFITIAKILLLIILIFTAIKSFGIGGIKVDKSPYEDVWDKNPNEWTDDEEEYVNDFFGWLKNQ